MWCFNLDTFLRVSWNCYLKTRFIEKPPVCSSSFSPSHLTTRTVKVCLCCTVWRKLPGESSETAGKYALRTPAGAEVTRRCRAPWELLERTHSRLSPASEPKSTEAAETTGFPPRTTGTWALHMSVQLLSPISPASLFSLYSLVRSCLYVLWRFCFCLYIAQLHFRVFFFFFLNYTLQPYLF